MDEFFFKEMRTWDQFKTISYCVCDWCESGELGGRCNSSGGNLLIQSCQTSATELLCENSQWPKHVDCFHKSAPLQTSNRILNKDATRSVVDVGCGWNASAWNL